MPVQGPSMYALKQTIDYYKRNSRPVLMCYLDASKAFDRVRGCAKKTISKNPRLLWKWVGPGAKTINVFRAYLSAQLTICAQKWRNFVLFSMVSFRFDLSRVCVFLYSLGPRSHSEFFLVGKSSQNTSKPVQIFWSSIPCVFCLYIPCYKLLVVMTWGFCPCQWWVSKKKFGWGVGGWTLSKFFLFLDFF